MTTGTNLQNVLGGRQLTGTLWAVKPGLPVDQLPPGLLTPTLGIEGNIHEWVQYTGVRSTATQVQYGAPSVRDTPTGVATKVNVLCHFANNREIKAATLVNLTDENGNAQKLGQSEVNRIVGETHTRLENTRAAVVMSAFALTKVYFSSSGGLQATSSGAQITVDYSVPSGNKNQLNILGTGAVIDTSWANPVAKIVKQMQNLKKQAGLLNGYIPTTAMYGSDILDLFLINNQTYDIITHNARFQEAFSSGEIPDGFLGMKWFPAYKSYYDVAGTTTEIFPTDNITFIPDVSSDWYDFVEGTTPVPQSFGASKNDMAGVLADVKMQRGMFSYAYGTMDPVAATMVYGDTFLPEIKVPGAVYTADVVF